MNKKWSLLEQGTFLKKMSDLLERGYSFSEAIESILFQMPIKRQLELKSCLMELKAGLPLYSVLSNLQFQKDIIGYIYFADKHGGMVEAISEGSKLMLNKYSNLQKLKKAFVYPIFLFFMTNILFVFVGKSLLPQYSALYDSMNLEVNYFSKVVSSFGEFLPAILACILSLLLLLVIFYFFYFVKIPILKQRRFLLNIPLIGSTLRLLQTQYLTLQLGYLLSGGISLHESLKLFESAPKNIFYQEIGAIMTQRLKRGEDVPAILTHIKFFERELPYIFNHGQRNGRLDKELLFFSQSCMKKLEDKMDKTLKLIQPIFYGIIALLVVSMYLSIMIPMFRMLDGI